jgi:hypothetical protein
LEVGEHTHITIEMSCLSAYPLGDTLMVLDGTVAEI